jgi:hypothetical protein
MPAARRATIILCYFLSAITILSCVLLAFFALQEVYNRAKGIPTELGHLYKLTDKQSIIFNSVDGVFHLGVSILIGRWLLKKKYRKCIIASISLWIVFFLLAYLEEGLRR